jgi:hypothetical protein
MVTAKLSGLFGEVGADQPVAPVGHKKMLLRDPYLRVGTSAEPAERSTLVTKRGFVEYQPKLIIFSGHVGGGSIRHISFGAVAKAPGHTVGPNTRYSIGWSKIKVTRVVAVFERSTERIAKRGAA